MGKTPDAVLTSQVRFDRYVARPDEHLALAEGALLIAEVAYPRLVHARYHRRLDTLALMVREALGATVVAAMRADLLGQRELAWRVLETMGEIIAQHEGITGDTEEYYDPRNSFLNQVLDRGMGLPITLSVVYLEVARRLGAPLVGVGLPSHFMVKWPLATADGGDLYLDAFSGGRVLDEAACQRFILEALGATTRRFDPRWAVPIGTRGILTRMLHNLKSAYLQRGETALALDVVDRLVALRPDLPAELRDRGLLRLALGNSLLAVADIAAYAERMPAAPELSRLRRRFSTLGEVRAKLN